MIYHGTALRDGPVPLRPVGKNDVNASIADPDVAQSRTWANRAELDPTLLYFGVYDGDRLVGQIFMHDIDAAQRETLIGYHIFAAADRGQGIGSRALRLLQNYLVGVPDLDRAIIITSVDNHASQRLAQRCGFSYIGPAREDPDCKVYEWRTPS